MRGHTEFEYLTRWKNRLHLNPYVQSTMSLLNVIILPVQVGML